MNYSLVLFDFDGTIVNSEPGIAECLAVTCREFGFDPNQYPAHKFIGPPIGESFSSILEISGDRLDAMIKRYRALYEERGLQNCVIYAGIPELLRELHDRGKTLAVASLKPLKFIETILARFDLFRYFSVVKGSLTEQETETKYDIIMDVMTAASQRPAIMIGDRFYDVEGAHRAGLPCIGVGYGFGDREELSPADFYAANVNDLSRLLTEI